MMQQLALNNAGSAGSLGARSYSYGAPRCGANGRPREAAAVHLFRVRSLRKVPRRAAMAFGSGARSRLAAAHNRAPPRAQGGRGEPSTDACLGRRVWRGDMHVSCLVWRGDSFMAPLHCKRSRALTFENLCPGHVRASDSQLR